MKTLLIFTLFFAIICSTNAQQNLSKTSIISLHKKIKISDRNLSDKLIGIPEIDKILEKYNVSQLKPLNKKSGECSVYTFTYSSVLEENHIISELKKVPDIKFVEQDQVGFGGGNMETKPNDKLYKRQWGLNNDGTFNFGPAIPGADVQMELAWDIETGDSNIVICVLDSGLKLDHPEFEGRLWVNKDEIPNNGIDDDNNALVDDINGYDYVNEDNLPLDDLGHGTNVTGIAAATGDNEIGYAGVDWHSKVMTIKCINSNNTGFYSWWIAGIYYAVDHGARVINMSLGGSSYSDIMEEAINYAHAQGVTVVVCMMNTNSEVTYYPAGYQNVIAVGSTDADDTRSQPFFWSDQSGSNFGNHISVVAPGNYIYGLHNQSATNYGTYWGGTSQATPLVAGITTLLLAQNPDLTPDKIKEILEQTAEDEVGNPAEDKPGFDKFYGHGRVNAYKALTYESSSTKNIQKPDDLINCYPNPSTGVFTIDFKSENSTVQIFNSLGFKIYSDKVVTSGKQNFYLNENGVYLIRIESANRIILRKLIINK